MRRTTRGNRAVAAAGGNMRFGDRGTGRDAIAGGGPHATGFRPATRHRVFLCAVFLGLTGLYGYLVYRLVEIQVLDHDAFVARAARYHWFERSPGAPRGRILDRRGAVIAESVPAKTLWARPAVLGTRIDLGELADRLSGVLAIPSSEIESRLTSRSSAVELHPGIEDNDVIAWMEEFIEGLERRGAYGLDLHDTWLRRYPFGSDLAPVVGVVGTDGDGLFGLEMIHDDALAGEGGREVLERDGRTRAFYSGPSVRREPRPGNDLRLTIDMVCQYFLERQVQWAFDTWEAAAVTGIVLAPESGEILAMATRPGFHPDRPGEWTRERTKNRSISDPVAPGSTFKPFIVAAALNEGLVSPWTRFDCGSGKHRFENRLVRDDHPEDELDVTGILVRSSNIGVAKIGRMLGKHRLQSYVENFGFGQLTGVGLAGESRGIVTPPSKWTETYTTVSVSFGQEIATTVLQLGLGVSALVNGGVYNGPRLVARIERPDGIHETPPLAEGEPVISERSSVMVREMLAEVCEEGSGKPARVPGYRVGGKTGTSEKFDGKVKRGYVSSFVGFAPVEDPRLVVVVMVDDPKGARYGRVVAAPAVGRVLADCLAYLEVPPTSDRVGARGEGGGISRSAAIETDPKRLVDHRGRGRSRSQERAW